MGPSEARAVKAVNAMKDMGISEKRVKPILRNLLRLYDKNWELIEDENYRVLIDAIFEQENVGEDENKNSDVHVPEESSQPPLKRVRTRAQAEQVSSSSEVPLVKPKVEGGGSPINRRLRSREHGSTASQVHDKGKEGPSLSHSLSDCEEISPPHVRDRAVPARSFLGVCLKEPKVEPGITIQPKQSLRDAREHSGLLRPKNEPMEVDPPFETPIAIISPSETERAIREGLDFEKGMGGDVILHDSEEDDSRVDNDIDYGEYALAETNVIEESANEMTKRAELAYSV